MSSDSLSLPDSYRHCQRLARQAASSFYWSFSLAGRERRRAMCALYAFSRLTDDIVDCPGEPGERSRTLELWRQQLDASFDGRFTAPLWHALADSVQRFEIPRRYLYDIIDGVAMDLTPPNYESFEELRHYCYRVASAVGLACIHIWGYEDERALELAETCGIAFQLTNILRDLHGDAVEGRVYLPREEMRRFEYAPEELKRGVYDHRFRDLMEFQVARAAGLYREAAALDGCLSPPGRRPFRLMFRTYRGLLETIYQRDFDVFGTAIRLPRRKSIQLLAGSLWPGGGLHQDRLP